MKVNNKSLIILISICVLAFAGLLFGIIYFSSNAKKNFYSAGFVSYSTASESSKIYINDNTTYKDGYNNKIVFKDKENQKVEVPNSSFVFYDDKSIGFLSRGVLVPLDNINDNFIPYYNIEDNYIIQYANNKYNLYGSDKNILINNFIGRISDTKYIVAGNNIRLKTNDSKDYIDSYYFELNFSDQNIVKIDSKDVSFETISDDAYIYVNDDIKIALSDGALFNKNKLVFSLSELVIDNDQNINITYDPKKAEEEKEKGHTTRYEIETVIENKNIPYVVLDMEDISIDSHKIDLRFHVVDDSKLITSSVVATLKELTENGKTVTKKFDNIEGILAFVNDSLKSNTKYLIKITTSYKRNGIIINDYVMFQKTIATASLGINLQKDYAQSDKLSFKVDASSSSEFNKAKLNLYDDKGSLISSKEFNKNDSFVLFDELNSNSLYIAKVENVMLGNVEYLDGSAATTSSKTLKIDPFKLSLLENPIAVTNKKDYNFEFDLSFINDPDNTISSVVYHIYDSETGNLVKNIQAYDKNKISVPIGDEIESFKTYYYNATVSISDGEKIVEHTTLDSNTFTMDSKISPTVRFKNDEITSNTLKGRFIITDDENAIDYTKNAYIEYTDLSGKLTTTDLIEYTECDDTKCVEVNLNNLLSDESYTLNLFAYVNLEDGKPAEFKQIGAIKLLTKKADVINVNYENIELDAENALQDIFNVNVSFSINEAETPETVKTNMSSFDILLYEGFDSNGLYIASKHIDSNIVADYFDNTKTLTLSDFGITFDDIRKMHLSLGTKLSSTFTILINNGHSGSEYVEFKPQSYTFRINDILIDLDDAESSIEINPIFNEKDKEYYDSSLKESTIVGFNATPVFGNKNYAIGINFKITDITDLQNQTYYEESFAYNEEEESTPTFEFLAKNYEILKRGHEYIFEYTVSLDLNGDGNIDYLYPFSSDNILVPDPVKSETVKMYNEDPSMTLFPWTSTASSIIYKYNITDIDNTVNVNDIYYFDGSSYNKGTAISCPELNNTIKHETDYKCIKFDNLIASKEYKINLNPIIINNGQKKYLEITSFNFEGEKNVNDVSYNVLLKDNKNIYNNLLTIDLGNSSSLSLIAYYTLELKYGNESFTIDYINSLVNNNKIVYQNESLTKKWPLDGATGNFKDVAYIDNCNESTCLYFDYAKLYNSSYYGSLFKNLKDKDIQIKLTAHYDSGLVGFLANTNKQYVFSIGNTSYLITTGSRDDLILNNEFALGAAYEYSIDGHYGFIDDDASDVLNSGKISFINNIYGTTLNKIDYHIENNGVNVKFKYNNVYENKVIVAKEIKSSVLNGNGMFKYENTTPSIKINNAGENKSNTINGLSILPLVTGVDESVLKDNNLYFEVYNEDETLVKEFNINNNEISTKNDTFSGNTYHLNSNNFLYNVTKVYVNNTLVEDFSYNYLTGDITFKENYSNASIKVNYQLLIYGLDKNSNYKLKAYMHINDTSKSYLADATSATYNTFEYEFSTIDLNNMYVAKVEFNTTSNVNYINRILDINYNISDIKGIKSVRNEVCSNSNTCLESSQLIIPSDAYMIMNNIALNKDVVYNANTSYDITINDDKNFEFDTDYNLKVYITVEGLDGNHEYLLYDDDIHVEALNNPDVIVQKNTGFYDGKKPYLDFNILVNDIDRTIVNPETSENGSYIAYLAFGPEKTEIANTRRTFNVITDSVEAINKALYKDNYDLVTNGEYYLIVEYDTYANNIESEKTHHFSIPYLIYTLDDNGIGIGKYEYQALKNKSILKFGYASNFIEDSLNENQEAYVAGIAYKITRVSGDNTFMINGSVIFDDDNKIENKNDGSDIGVGENYYQITLKDTNYPVLAGYNILFRFYITGNVAKNLDTEIKCLDNSPTNIWQNDKCLILDNTSYNAYALYEGGTN